MHSHPVRTCAAWLSLAVAFACPLTALAQGEPSPAPAASAAPALSPSKASITGRVVDAQTSLPVGGATVQIVDRRVSTATASDGSFRFFDLAPGVYQLRVSRNGYVSADSDTLALLAGASSTVTLAMQAAPTNERLDVIGRTAVKTVDALQSSSTTYRSLSPEQLLEQGTWRAGDALRELPAINNGITGDTAALGDDLNLNIRGIGTLETETTFDGHPVAQGVPGGYNFQLSPVFGLRNIQVTYGSGSNLYGVSAIGGIVDFQTIDPTPDRRVVVNQGYGTFDKAATSVAITGPLGKLGYALAAGVASLDGPLKNLNMYQPAAAFDQSAPVGSPVYNLGIYQDDSTVVSRSSVGKLRYAFSQATNLTFTGVVSSYWENKTGNGDGDYLNYIPALAFGNAQLAGYKPKNYPKLPACPAGTFPGFNANSQPNGTGPNGMPDGGTLCQTPQQYATYNSGWQGAGPAWQSFNFNDEDLTFQTSPRNQLVRVDAFTNRYLDTVDRRYALPFVTVPGTSTQAATKNTNVSEAGVTLTDTIFGRDNELRFGYSYLNIAYNLKSVGANTAKVTDGTPVVSQRQFLFHDAYHAQNSPLTAYLDLNGGTSTATNTSYVDPRLSVADAVTARDVVRIAAGATTTQPAANQLQKQFVASALGGAGGGKPITCGALNSIGSTPSSILKPEQGVDQELSWGHRFNGDSQAQLTLYNVNVYDKLYSALVPISQTGTGFIDPATLATDVALVANTCGLSAAQAAQLLGVTGTLNIGQLRAQGFMLGGRQRINARAFIDYDWALDSTALISVPATFLQSNLTDIVGSQLPRLPLHTIQTSFDQTVGRTVDLRYTYHWVSANNTKTSPPYDYSDLRMNVAAGPGVFTAMVTNLFNEDAFIQGYRYQGVPLALNQYATAASYTPYTGAAATELFGIPYRMIYFNYTFRTK